MEPNNLIHRKRQTKRYIIMGNNPGKPSRSPTSYEELPNLSYSYTLPTTSSSSSPEYAHPFHRLISTPNLSLDDLRKYFESVVESGPPKGTLNSNVPGICAQCGKAEDTHQIKLKKCSRCQMVRYCSVNCQRIHWLAGHKSECVEAKATDTFE